MRFPEWMEDVFYKYQTGEFTYNDRGRPTTIPVIPLYDADRGSLIIHTPIAFYHKVRCVKRNPKVTLLYSNPMHSGINENSVILVQGEAIVQEEDLDENWKYVLDLLGRQRDSLKKVVYENSLRQMNSSLGKILMNWYLKKIVIEVTPHKILTWHNGDLDEEPEILEVK